MKFVERRSGKFVSPGDRLGVIEEFLPGGGTYTEDGNIYSSTTGHLLMDLHDRRISVYPKTRRPLTPNEGNLVLGIVKSVRDKNLTLKIVQIEDKPLYTYFDGVMHISDVSEGYVKTMLDAFKVGDIVRAKVISTKNREIHLTTQGSELGVIQAKCSLCGHSLILDKNNLRCPQCNRARWRKIAYDYGKSPF
jgi:exosome complex component CSL4